MAELAEVYTQATYYDIVFGRDVTHEFNFMRDVYRMYNDGREPTSIIDIACGPGYHAITAAEHGLFSIGLDLRQEMIELGQLKASERGVNIFWITQDMRQFKLKTPVDIALTSYDSIDVLKTDEDAICHFRAVRDNLTPGGIYIVDVTHPRDTNYGIYNHFYYTGERDNIKIKIEWEVHEPFDLLTGLSKVTVHLYATHPNGSVHHYAAPGEERLYLPRELDSLVELSGGLRRIGWYGDFRVNQPLDYSSRAVRAIGIYQRI